MTNEDGFSDPIFVLLGSCLTMVATAIAWYCKNRCRNQSVDCSSPCCKIHSDSRLRQTIREIAVEEVRKTQSSLSSDTIDLEMAVDEPKENASD